MDDILREALQGMRQPQPGVVFISDVLAYVEPEMERLRLEEMFGNQRHAERLGEAERAHDERQAALGALTEAEADRDRARDAAVALEQENARVRSLHSSRMLTEYSDDDRKEETGHTWLICESCTDSDIVGALDDGELIEEGETASWPCATIRAMDGGEG